MKPFILIWRALVRSLAYTSAYALLIYFITAFSDPDRNAIVASQFLFLLLFGLISGFSQELLRLRRLPLIARIGIHYGTLLLSLFLICVLSQKIVMAFGTIAIFFIVFTIVYAVVMLITMLILQKTGIYEQSLSYLTDGKPKDSTYTNRF